ncbi:MAG TPA: metal-dependent hydrolase [Chloroflexia bacterium]|nr:metal-dependent hydrolase [Chloroflexia bacterium]
MGSIGKDVKITWYGHGTFLFETPGGKRILIDPWVQNNPACPEHLKKVEKLDAMLITHGHFDHITDALQVATEASPDTVVGILETAGWLEKKGVQGVMGMNKGGTVDVAGMHVTMLHADHSCGIQEDDGSIIYGGEAVGYLMEMENGFKIYHSGDTAFFGDMRLYGEFFQPDLAVLPIGDYFTMDPRQAAYACEMLGVKWVIPGHHSTFPLLTGTPAQLREELKKRGYKCEVLELKPGETAE